MNQKEFVTLIEEHVDRLAATCSYSSDKQQVQQLREALFAAASDIVRSKLTEKVAYRFADQVLAKARAELKLRQKAAVAAATATPPQ